MEVTERPHRESSAIGRFITFPERKGHSMPCKSTWGAPGFCQEAEAGMRGKPTSESLLGFPWESKAGPSKQFRVGSFEEFQGAMGYTGGLQLPGT